MKTSVVICTYGRPEAAKSLLIKLQRQRYKDFEVLLICQGNKEDLEKIKDSIKNIYPVRYYYEAGPNLPHARNIGIKEASGEIIIFLDDDVKPGDTLIEAHVANYTDSTIGVVGGRILDKKYKENIPDSKIGMVRKFDGFTYAGFHKGIRRYVMHVKGVNMSVRRELALEIGGFDERFGGTAQYEDMDFCLRALKKGYKIIFDPAAVVEHFILPSGGCRVDTREEAIYWLYHNHSLVFLNNFNVLFYPILIIEYVIRIIRLSFRWRNLKVIEYAFKGVRDGPRAYFK